MGQYHYHILVWIVFGYELQYECKALFMHECAMHRMNVYRTVPVD